MILVLNLGLKSVRAIVFSESGAKLKASSLPINTTLRGDFVEQDPEEWWKKSVLVIQQALTEKEVRDKVTTLTVTSSSSCLVSLDRKFTPLRHAIMVSDMRARRQASRIMDTVWYKDAVYRGGKARRFHASLMVPKVLWLREHEQEIFNRAEFFASPNDYLIQRMTGIFVTDPLNAEKFFFDVGSGSYPTDLFLELDIRKECLPPVAGIGSTVGQVLPEVKQLLGFSSGQPINVVLSTYDAICAFLGSGVTEEGEGCVVSGTVSSLRVLSWNEPALFNDGIFTQFDPTHQIYIIGGSNNLGGGLIEWAKQCLYRGEKYPYEVMESEARQSSIGGHGLLFLPYLLGERAPHWDLSLRGVFFGLERAHERKDLIRAVFESVGYSIKDIAEAIESQQIKLEGIRFSGGLSRLPLVGELLADILNEEVCVLEEFETTSLGAYLIAAISNGIFQNLQDASKVVKVREIFVPDPEKHAMYDSLHELYTDVRISLRECYQKRHSIVEKLYFDSAQRIENL